MGTNRRFPGRLNYRHSDPYSDILVLTLNLLSGTAGEHVETIWYKAENVGNFAGNAERQEIQLLALLEPQ